MSRRALSKTLMFNNFAMLVILAIGIVPFPGVGQAFAQPQMRQNAPANRPLATQSSDHVTIVVLDMSGSMSANDPEGIRCSAANAYIDLSGIGSYIGVVGLDNNNGSRGGPRNFQQAAVWANPSEMATLSQRHGLEQAIATKSHNCAPDGNTPTYDALYQALTMLRTSTQNGQISGSVILLTDGVPAPDTTEQVDAIKADLVPQFQQHNWPVDTIALGKAQDFAFLNDIANGTSGKFYDDAQGVVDNGGNGSPLNIAPFFVNIFAQRNHRTPGPNVTPTLLNGGSTSRDFQVGDYVDHLDVVAIKDRPGTQITLTAPGGQTIQPTTAGTNTVSDMYGHYVIFSIGGPQKGSWTFTIRGSGSFLMDSLITSSLTVSILSPAANGPALPLGQDLTIKAILQDNGNQVTSPNFTVKATISFAGDLPFGANVSPQTIVLSDNDNPGIYQGSVNIPLTAPAGSYEIRVVVKQSTQVSKVEDSRTIRLELFPLPCLGPCGSPLQPTIVEWDPVTRLTYGLPVGIIDWLSHWPLGGLPARTEAHLTGQVYLKGVPYQNATVKVSATRKDMSGKDVATPVTLVNDGKGRFRLILPYTGPGVYTLSFQTSGSFKDSHGDFGLTTVKAQPHLTSATFRQEAQDSIVSFIYLLILLLIVLLIRMAILPKPFGGYQKQPGSGDPNDFDEFARVRRAWWNRLLHPNKIWTYEMGLDPRLVFIFGRDHIRAKSSNYTLDHTSFPAGAPAVDGHIVTEPGREGDSYQIVGNAEIVNDDDFGKAMESEDDQDEFGGRRSTGLGMSFGLPWRQSKGRRGSDDTDNTYDFGYDDEERPRKGRQPRRGRRSRQEEDDRDYTF